MNDRSMKIAIIGTRGIPNNYGGFEQFAEYISVNLAQRGHDVTVYNPHFHIYKENMFKGVHIRHVYCPEKYLKAMAHFIYDWLCLKDALKQGFDIIYEAGYHSNALSYLMLKKNHPVVITNMDGLEWKRSKWSWVTRQIIKWLERLAVHKSDYLISDNKGIQEYYQKRFGKDSFYVAYGANVVANFDESVLTRYALSRYNYYILIARLEPENNIETVLDGYIRTETEYPFIVVGNNKTRYGKHLMRKYKDRNVRFIGASYNKEDLDVLRKYACIYFHGHSVGGTNPSLLEAMASEALIAAHHNIFNQSVLQQNAFYFEDSSAVARIIDAYPTLSGDIRKNYIEKNRELIEKEYSWEYITTVHESLFMKLLSVK